MAHHPINKWGIVICGYTQDVDRPVGMVRLWNQLEHEVGTDRRVELKAWGTNVKTLAEHVWLQRDRGGTNPPATQDIVVAGYSWGGMSAINLCRQFKNRGMEVRHLFLVDAVYRHRYVLGQWRALFQFRKLHVPTNVHKVTWWRQRQNWPQGHDVVAVDTGSP